MPGLVRMNRGVFIIYYWMPGAGPVPFPRKGGGGIQLGGVRTSGHSPTPLSGSVRT